MSLKEELSKAVGAFANKVGDVSKKAGAQAKIMTEIAKLNIKISQEEDKIRKAQTELGKLYYNDFEAGLPIEAETYLPLCNEIKASKEAIAAHREAVEELKKQPEAREEAVEDVVEEASDEDSPTDGEIEFTVVDEDSEDSEKPNAE